MRIYPLVGIFYGKPFCLKSFLRNTYSKKFGIKIFPKVIIIIFGGLFLFRLKRMLLQISYHFIY